jgi:hypothetical protein
MAVVTLKGITIHCKIFSFTTVSSKPWQSHSFHIIERYFLHFHQQLFQCNIKTFFCSFIGWVSKKSEDFFSLSEKNEELDKYLSLAKFFCQCNQNLLESFEKLVHLQTARRLLEGYDNIDNEMEFILKLRIVSNFILPSLSLSLSSEII